MIPARTPVAAIDLGTNTALLLVARLDDRGRLEVVEDLCRTPRLGAGLALRGTIDPEAEGRAVAALMEFAGRIRAHGIAPSRVRVVGTAVLRRARDGAQSAQRIAQATGLALEVIPESEEARLGALAMAAEGAGPDALVVDVGGGSTEVACAELRLSRSIPIGAVVLSEEFLGEQPPRPGGWGALRAATRAAATRLPGSCAGARPCFAIGGSAVNLACLDGGFDRFDAARAEGAAVDAERVGEWADRLAALSLPERLALPLEAERAAILPAGLAALAAVAERLGARRLWVSGRGLRYAIARELLGRAEKASPGPF